MQCGPPDAGCQELRLSFQKLLLLLVRQVEANRLLSQDTCLTCDVNTNQTHNAALAASLSKQQRRCYGTALCFPPAAVKTKQMSPRIKRRVTTFSSVLVV